MLSSVAIIIQVVLSTFGHDIVFAMPSLVLQVMFWLTAQVLALFALRGQGWNRRIMLTAALSGLLLLNNLSFLNAEWDEPDRVCRAVLTWTPELDGDTIDAIIWTEVWATATIELTPLGDVTCTWEFPPDYDHWPRHYTFNALATYPVLRQ